MAHNRDSTSELWPTAPAGRNCIPNVVLQPLILTWVRWTGWSFIVFDIVDHVSPLAATVWQYPREDLVVMGGLDQIVWWFTAEERTSKEVIARE